MRGRGRLVWVVVIGVVAAAIGAATPAFAATIHVHRGESIQAAVDSANPGDTIVVEAGTYRQIVEIATSDITLKGSGDTASGTNLTLPAGSPVNDCSFGDPTQTPGICVFSAPGQPPVADVTVQGFFINGFPSEGLLAFNTQELTVAHDTAANNGGYGFFNNSSTGGSYLYSRAYGSHEAGFYIGDSQSADFTMIGNLSYRNTFGGFIRDASNGTVAHNRFYNNCVGILMLAGAPGPVTGWDVENNSSNNNNSFCPPGDEGGPALSGIGIAIAGASGNTISHNTVWGNQPSGVVPFAGGIVMAKSGKNWVPSGNSIASNVLYNNLPYDVFVKDSLAGGNTFAHNQCGTSKPKSICA